ncbi:MAG TPA: hypothetical protein VGF24_14020 [Vicinamibacterales bacterium]
MIAIVRESSAAALMEALDALVEAFVGVMHQQIALAEGLEDVRTVVESLRRHRRPRGIAQGWHIEIRYLEEARIVQFPLDFVHVVAGQLEALLQHCALE